MSLQSGIKALKQGHYQEAIEQLEAFCQRCPKSQVQDFIQAKMALAKAYTQIGETEKAIAICEKLSTSKNSKLSGWAIATLSQLQSATKLDIKELLQKGDDALKAKNYPEAIRYLEDFCQRTPNPDSPDYRQAKMWLVKAYQGNHDLNKALEEGKQLTNSDDTLIRGWATQTVASLHAAEIRQKQAQSQPEASTTPLNPSPTEKARRVAQTGVKLAMKGITGSLALASLATLSLLFGMVLVLSLALIYILGSENPTSGLMAAIIITLGVNVAIFFLSPLLMDSVQTWFYKTRWVSLAEVRRYSPESAEVIERVCREKKIKQPRLGLIEDENPTAFTYGSLPNSARLVVSRGLFTYLDDEEIATVYAHELGHIIHWDFAVMTLAATLVQITYLIYVFARNLGKGRGNNKAKDAAQTAAIAAYIFYIVGTYLVLFLSRTREYYADHFAAETTGNPNGLSRALVKIAYGIVEEAQKNPEPSKLVEGTRALGIYDPKAATSTGTAYRIASNSQKVGRVFLWDIFNPWGWLMELNSTHPLTGKRIRALTTYAEQMGLETEFNMALIVREGNKLNKKKLYRNFAIDLLLYGGQLIGLILGIIAGVFLISTTTNPLFFFTAIFCGFGLGTLIKTFIMFPDYQRAATSDILNLMSDPYASPLRGRPVKLQGTLIGRGDVGYQFGSDLKLQDTTGMIYVRYLSCFGSLGNFLFGWKKVKNLIGSNVTTTGWFRRGIMPWIDLIQLQPETGKIVNSYHRFWSLVVGIGAIVLGVAIPLLF